VVVQVSGGPLYQRDIDVRGRVYSLSWLNRPLADIMQLRQWARQYRDGFFTYYDIEQNRYFTGKFLNSLKISGGGNDAYSAQGIFVEIPNLAMSTYPSNWARDAIFWEQNDDNGNARTKQTGVWTPAVNANAHGAATDELTNTNLNATDMVELVYIGYGFRLWARKDANLGHLQRRHAGERRRRAGGGERGPLRRSAGGRGRRLDEHEPEAREAARDHHRHKHKERSLSSAKTILFDAIEIMT
jgi:hypothetical protein